MSPTICNKQKQKQLNKQKTAIFERQEEQMQWAWQLPRV